MNKAKNCAGKDCFERLNYLYQISNISLQNKYSLNVASALYSHHLLSIAKKSVQRLDLDIKRSLCKKCHNLMVSGISAKVRIRKKHVYWSCIKCKISKKFKTTRKYVPWVQDPAAIIESLKY